ncbi:Ig-like domain-containing protein [Halopenitus persicus]|uniref:Ig-like domain-containing protein n=1 Tax=Halopenitus persicus TaxID=1048396 RepID=UPI0012FDF0FF|nr:Ig-like domain-containing protein [Halopenitus persicus]
MDARGGDRAQSMQIGAILLFGFLIVSISVMQATVIPDQNRQVEFAAYQEAAADLTDVRNDVLAAAGRDATAGTTVNTGVDYPNRLLFVNPGPPPNRLSTTDERTITIENMQAVDGEPGNVRTFVESNVDGRTATTRDLRFDPDYNVFTGQPMVVTGQEAYRVAGSRPIPMASQTLLRDDRIRITLLRGDVDAGGSSVSLTAETTSAATGTVVVTGSQDGRNDIELRLQPPAGVDAAEWAATTGTRLESSNDRVLDVAATGGNVVVTLDGTRRYRLRTAVVTLRDGDDGGNANGDPDPAYVTTVLGQSRVVPPDTELPVVVEVRDRHNNPVGGATVDFTVTNGGSVVGPSTISTNAAGRAEVVFTGPDPNTEYTVTATILDGSETYESASYEIQVTQGPRGGGPENNPGKGNQG